MYIERVENGEAGILQSAAGIFEGLGIAVLDRFFLRVARAAVEAFAGAPRVLAQGYTKAPPRRIARNARTIDAASDDDKIDGCQLPHAFAVSSG